METEENNNPKSKFKILLEHIVPSEYVSNKSKLTIYIYYVFFSLYLTIFFIFFSIKNILSLRFRRIKYIFLAIKEFDSIFKDHFKI